MKPRGELYTVEVYGVTPFGDIADESCHDNDPPPEQFAKARAAQWRRDGFDARTFQRDIKADRVRIPCWVVVVRTGGA